MRANRETLIMKSGNVLKEILRKVKKENKKEGADKLIELKDTVKSMESEDYKERFIAEYLQLKICRDKLGEFIKKYKHNQLSFVPATPIAMLEDQMNIMTNYMNVLENRARIEKINWRGCVKVLEDK